MFHFGDMREIPSQIIDEKEAQMSPEVGSESWMIQTNVPEQVQKYQVKMLLARVYLPVQRDIGKADAFVAFQQK